ncbi:hypothetical protein AAMO2058_001259200 [Amorphochlora amoebiformis]
MKMPKGGSKGLKTPRPTAQGVSEDKETKGEEEKGEEEEGEDAQQHGDSSVGAVGGKEPAGMVGMKEPRGAVGLKMPAGLGKGMKTPRSCQGGKGPAGSLDIEDTADPAPSVPAPASSQSDKDEESSDSDTLIIPKKEKRKNSSKSREIPRKSRESSGKSEDISGKSREISRKTPPPKSRKPKPLPSKSKPKPKPKSKSKPKPKPKSKPQPSPPSVERKEEKSGKSESERDLDANIPAKNTQRDPDQKALNSGAKTTQKQPNSATNSASSKDTNRQVASPSPSPSPSPRSTATKSDREKDAKAEKTSTKRRVPRKGAAGKKRRMGTGARAKEEKERKTSSPTSPEEGSFRPKKRARKTDPATYKNHTSKMLKGNAGSVTRGAGGDTAGATVGTEAVASSPAMSASSGRPTPTPSLSPPFPAQSLTPSPNAKTQKRQGVIAGSSGSNGSSKDSRKRYRHVQTVLKTAKKLRTHAMNQEDPLTKLPMLFNAGRKLLGAVDGLLQRDKGERESQSKLVEAIEWANFNARSILSLVTTEARENKLCLLTYASALCETAANFQLLNATGRMITPHEGKNHSWLTFNTPQARNKEIAQKAIGLLFKRFMGRKHIKALATTELSHTLRDLKHLKQSQGSSEMKGYIRQVERAIQEVVDGRQDMSKFVKVVENLPPNLLITPIPQNPSTSKSSANPHPTDTPSSTTAKRDRGESHGKGRRERERDRRERDRDRERRGRERERGKGGGRKGKGRNGRR